MGVSVTPTASTPTSASTPANTGGVFASAGPVVQVTPAVSATGGGGSIVTVQVSAPPVPGQAAPALPAGTRVEASISAGAFNVVYSQSTAQAAGQTTAAARPAATTGAGTGTGTGGTPAPVSGPGPSGSGVGGGNGSVSAQGDGADDGALASASSFNTFRADETPTVSLVEDKQGTDAAAGRRGQQGGGS